MKGVKFYKWVIALLIIINIGTLAFIWFGRPPHPPRPGDEPRLAYDIGLTGDNKEKVDSLEVQHHKDKSALMALDRELHKEYFSLIGSDQNTQEIEDKMHANKVEIEEMTFEFFDSVASYCNEEQLKTLKTFIESRLIQFGPPHPGKH